MTPERAGDVLELWLKMTPEELDKVCLSEPARMAVDELRELRALYEEKAAVNVALCALLDRVKRWLSDKARSLEVVAAECSWTRHDVELALAGEVPELQAVTTPSASLGQQAERVRIRGALGSIGMDVSSLRGKNEP